MSNDVTINKPVITEAELKEVVPKSVRKAVTPQMVATLNSLVMDDEFREAYRDNLITYSTVLRDGKFKMENYLDAVRYVTNKLLGNSNLQAYIKTFPDRYNKLVADGRTPKEISSYVSMYNNNKLVTQILEQTLVPVHIMNADIYQKAINVQADLMMNAKSEKVRSDAANSLLTHLKRPETQKLEIDMSIKEDGTIDELRKTTMELVAQQKAMIQSQYSSVKEIAESRIIDITPDRED
jgi:hypothetical protein